LLHLGEKRDESLLDGWPLTCHFGSLSSDFEVSVQQPVQFIQALRVFLKGKNHEHRLEQQGSTSDALAPFKTKKMVIYLE
jgi:hypothetical protein